MSISKGNQGQWIVSDIVDGYLVTRQFFGYTRKESKELFKAYIETI